MTRSFLTSRFPTSPSDTDSQIPCSITLSNQRYKQRYNFCPLLQTGNNDGTDRAQFQISVDEETPPTRTTKVFSINLNEGLKWDGTLPEELQCPRGTRICLTVTNTRPSRPADPARVIQVVPIARSEGLRPRYGFTKTDGGKSCGNGSCVEHRHPGLVLHGGEYVGQKQIASFVFVCDRESENSVPDYSWSFNGTHTFTWKSKYACPLDSNNDDGGGSAPDNPPTDSDPPLEPPKSPDEEGRIPSLPEGPLTLSGFTVRFCVLAGLFYILYRLIVRPRLRAFSSSSSSYPPLPPSPTRSGMRVPVHTRDLFKFASPRASTAALLSSRSLGTVFAGGAGGGVEDDDDGNLEEGPREVAFSNNNRDFGDGARAQLPGRGQQQASMPRPLKRYGAIGQTTPSPSQINAPGGPGVRRERTEL